jgi:predicted XRE-type DNA-binding protein
MPLHDHHYSELELWIRKRNMTTNQFVKMVGCSRPTVWKVKKGIPISKEIAEKITLLTNGAIEPVYNYDDET